ncbi:ATP-dependent 3'-5' DNA helicase, partial [Basidiobolus ranarum]
EIDPGVITDILEALIAEYVPHLPDEAVVEEVVEQDVVFPSIERLIESIISKSEFVKEQVLHKEVVSVRDPVFGSVSDLPVRDEVIEALKDIWGIDDLYSHQAEAIKNVFLGKHIAVSTSTSSGKSLIFNVPILSTLLENPSLRALYIFPNKALAQDQIRNLNMLLSYSDKFQSIKASTYDGDTESAKRSGIRDECQILFTNPDMLHANILPFHRQYWHQFLLNLRFVVIDEIHTYFLGDDMENDDSPLESAWRRSFFGVHVSCVLRRLRRICDIAYGNNSVQFICASATIDDPLGQLRFLCGFDDKFARTDHYPELFASTDYHPTGLSVVCADGSPCGQKHYVIWQPDIKNIKSIEDKRRLNLLKKYEKYNKSLFDVTLLFITSIYHNFRTILFCKSRNTCEQVMNSVVARLEKSSNSHLKDKISSYRGGYLQQERREIERRLFQGDLLGVITTNALELGLDIGSIDVVIHYGFPDSRQSTITNDGKVTSNMFSSYFQQAGRSGRRQQESLSLLVLDGSGRDEWLVNNIDQIFSRLRNEDLSNTMEPSLDESQNTDNFFRLEKFRGIVERQLQCAAHEQVIIIEKDINYFGGRHVSLDHSWLLRLLDRHLPFYEDATDVNNVIKYYRPSSSYLPYPANTFSLRTSIHSGDSHSEWSIMTTAGVLLENMDHYRAAFTVYPKALFYRRGIVYIILRWNVDSRNIIAQAILNPNRSALPTNNSPHTAWSTEQGKIIESETLIGLIDVKQCLGNMQVTFSVNGFSQRDPNKPDNIISYTYTQQEKPPPVCFETYGCWITIPESFVSQAITTASALSKDHIVRNQIATVISLLNHSLLYYIRIALQGKGIAIDQWSLKTECIDLGEPDTKQFRLMILDAAELRQPSLPLSQVNGSIIRDRIPASAPIPIYLQTCHKIFKDTLEKMKIAFSSCRILDDPSYQCWEVCGVGCALQGGNIGQPGTLRWEVALAIAKSLLRHLTERVD